MGNERELDDVRTTCLGAATNRQMNKTHALDGTRLNPDAVAYPCGLTAKSVFNDTFKLYDDGYATYDDA